MYKRQILYYTKAITILAVSLITYLIFVAAFFVIEIIHSGYIPVSYTHLDVYKRQNLLSIYHEGSKAQLIEDMTAALPYMDAGLRELAKRTLSKVGALTEAEYRELAVYPADEV